MKILIVTDTYYPHVNGASYFTQRLAWYLARRGHSVRVIAPSRSFADTEESIAGILVHGIWSFPILFYKGFRACLPFFMRSRVRKVLRAFQPDVIHVQGHFSLSRAVIAENRGHSAVIATNHFMPENLMHYLPLPGFALHFINRVAWLDFSRIFNKADVVTTPTETAAALIRPYLRMSAIPVSCGIDLDRFRPDNDGVYLKERYHIPDKPVLLYVGRLDKEKNIDVIIRAVAEAKAKADFVLVIAGTGVERDNLVALAKELEVGDKVIFAGFVPDEDLPNLYVMADCFAIACEVELQSIVSMEAMASGLPVIAVRAGALPELAHDGENGFLFEPRDSAGLARAISTVFSDPALASKLGETSLRIVAAHGIGTVMDRYESLYRAEIGKKKGRYAGTESTQMR